MITGPYSRMVWLETIITKSAEEVYDKFVNRFLLEEGCPKVILADNGREFSSKLLRELMRLCRIRLKYRLSIPNGQVVPRWSAGGAVQHR